MKEPLYGAPLAIVLMLANVIDRKKLEIKTANLFRIELQSDQG